MPSPPEYGDVRLRLDLPGEPFETRWPDHFLIRQMEPADIRAAHALLIAVFTDEERDYGRWYNARIGDEGYDHALNFVAEHTPTGEVQGVVWCWSSNYIKDLAVAPVARGRGLGRALMLTALNAFIDREAPFVDLKTNQHKNAAAYRMYKQLGMYEVDWSGGQLTENIGQESGDG